MEFWSWSVWQENCLELLEFGSRAMPNMPSAASALANGASAFRRIWASYPSTMLNPSNVLALDNVRSTMKKLTVNCKSTAKKDRSAMYKLM